MTARSSARGANRTHSHDLYAKPLAMVSPGLRPDPAARPPDRLRSALREGVSVTDRPPASGEGSGPSEDDEQEAGTVSKLVLTAAPFIFLVVVWLVLRAVSG